jgi:hypothetical protein
MGYKLRREVRDALPPTVLSPGERVVILEIADDAGDETRRTMKGPKDLAPRADVTVEAFCKHVQRIEYKGIPLRIEIGKGKGGKPMYAHQGKQTNYLIPPIEVLRSARKPGQSVQPQEGGQSVQEWVDNSSTPEGWTDCPERVDDPSNPSPQRSSEKNSPPPQGAASGRGEEDAAQVINRSGHQLRGIERTRLIGVVADALVGGHSEREILAELAKPTAGLNNVAAGLISRIKTLAADPPAQAEPEAPKIPCLLHRSSDVYNCPCCWSEVKTGDDPYERCPDLRPDGWHEVYAWTPPSRTVVVDEVDVEPCSPRVADAIGDVW